MASSDYLYSLRNIGVIAHIDAGKTTLTERILFYTDKIHRMGEVHDGTATMDFMPEEQERGITIASACTSCEWNGKHLNIIDTPGHVDFTIEVERSLRVLDGAIGVFCAVGGVEPQSETVWRQSEKFGVPKIVFINKMDRLGANFSAVIDSIKERLKANPVPVVVPLGEGDEFEALADVVTLERIDFDQEEEGRTYTRSPLAPHELESVAVWRDMLIESVAERNDDLMEIYLAGETIQPDAIRAELRKATLASEVVPVFSGSALRNTGVQMVLDGVCDFLPSPAEVSAPCCSLNSKQQAVTVDPDAALAALAFKVYMDDGRKMVMLRLYSGSMQSGESYYNTTQGEIERIARLYKLHAGRRERVDVAKAGDIVAAAGMKVARTGDTLATKDEPFLLENISGLKPVISLALEPRNSEEGDKLDEVLQKFLLEDPTLAYAEDEDTGQRVVSGMGELHLEVVIDRLKREYKVDPRVGNPQVVYQETVTKAASATHVFDRDLGEQHHHGEVALNIQPRDRDAGSRTRFAFATEEWPQEWLDAVVQGIQDSLQSGVVKGYPVQDVDVSVSSMIRKEGASSPAGFRMAAVFAMNEAMAMAAPALLEPIMDVEVTVPDAHVGDAISLLGAKGAKVENMFDRAGQKVVQALAPMRKLFGFSTDLRSVTQGRAGLVMKFSRFDMLA